MIRAHQSHSSKNRNAVNAFKSQVEQTCNHNHLIIMIIVMRIIMIMIRNMMIMVDIEQTCNHNHLIIMMIMIIDDQDYDYHHQDHETSGFN